MTNTIMNTVLSVLVSGTIGYLIGLIKTYKKKLIDKQNESAMLKEALMTMLQNNLTNTYYVYEQKKKIPDYVYRNWIKSAKIYEELDGDDYIHILAEKMKDWEFIKTDILN